ncbi:MAG: hypothetical protein D6731_17465 [Planctomycetota bacterium]|nr:MAG: hypothetical protein D6731_17465 [Planctomycetota bacterium]
MTRRAVGFSLLEVLFAMGVLATVLLALASIVHSSSRLDQVSRERILAYQAAASRLELVLGEPWDTLLARNGETFTITGELPSGNVAERLRAGGGRTAPGLVTVSETGTPDLRRVEVSVLWRSDLGKDLEVRLETLVAKH